MISDQCGSMQNLAIKFGGNPQLQKQFEEERNRFNAMLRQGMYRLSASQRLQNGNRTALVIPVVFHIVLTDQSLVTDAQIQAQLDTLNKDFAGLNGDSVNIPAYFKPFFGKSGIQFCLAKQTTWGQPTSGIERILTSVIRGENVKYSASGGADSWDPLNYFNIWISQFGNANSRGLATFPGTGKENEQGVVINYLTIPRGSFPDHSNGRTLTHETGHYLNLYHIWGDDGNACSGTDYVDDTPNQGGATLNCNTGIKTDNCSNADGIMYQNYMDYSPDNCQVMFTAQQVARMESALIAYRSSLLSSIACQTPVLYNIDAQLRSINQPGQRICSNPFTPSINIRNRGTQTLTALTITTVVDNTTVGTYAWTGSLAQLASTDITLNAIITTAGNHVLKIYLSNPNNSTDQNTINDSLSIGFQYYNPVSTVTESFEESIFPPAGWDIVNPGNGITWQKVNGVAKTGSSSVMINNIRYPLGQQDYIRLPEAILSTSADSAFFSFQIAAAAYADINTSFTLDTLEILISKDCGNSYTSLYKKWGSNLVTHTEAISSYFAPTPAEWRKDSINISNYIGSGKILLVFKNTGYGSYTYVDDISIRTAAINPMLKSRGFLVTPSPTTGLVTVQFYPQPAAIKGIQIFNMSGQKVAETITNGQSNYYQLDISHAAAGAYVVRIVMGDKVLVKKIIKY